MTRPAMPDDLMSTTEIAHLLGVTQAAVSNWKSRHDNFPQPWGIVAGRELYLRAEVREWIREERAELLDFMGHKP